MKEMAILAIFKYFDGYYTKEYIKDTFKLAIKLLVSNATNSAKMAGVSSITENGTSITYKGDYERFTLTSDVIALLPNKINYRAW